MKQSCRQVNKGSEREGPTSLSPEALCKTCPVSVPYFEPAGIKTAIRLFRYKLTSCLPPALDIRCPRMLEKGWRPVDDRYDTVCISSMFWRGSWWPGRDALGQIGWHKTLILNLLYIQSMKKERKLFETTIHANQRQI